MTNIGINQSVAAEPYCLTCGARVSVGRSRVGFKSTTGEREYFYYRHCPNKGWIARLFEGHRTTEYEHSFSVGG